LKRSLVAAGSGLADFFPHLGMALDCTSKPPQYRITLDEQLDKFE
jgi:hypothetical protein